MNRFRFEVRGMKEPSEEGSLFEHYDGGSKLKDRDAFPMYRAALKYFTDGGDFNRAFKTQSVSHHFCGRNKPLHTFEAAAHYMLSARHLQQQVDQLQAQLKAHDNIVEEMREEIDDLYQVINRQKEQIKLQAAPDAVAVNSNVTPMSQAKKEATADLFQKAAEPDDIIFERLTALQRRYGGGKLYHDGRSWAFEPPVR